MKQQTAEPTSPVVFLRPPKVCTLSAYRGEKNPAFGEIDSLDTSDSQGPEKVTFMSEDMIEIYKQNTGNFWPWTTECFITTVELRQHMSVTPFVKSQYKKRVFLQHL